MMQNIVVLGGSNSRVPNSFYAGICGDEEGEFKVHNLSVGGSEALHKIYNLNDKRYQELFQNADLLILETNIMDDKHYRHIHFDSELLKRNVKWLFNELYKSGKKVLVCILFSPYSRAKDWFLVSDLYEKLCRHYGFNFINFHQKMFDLNLQDFCISKLGSSHIFFPIMYEFGKNIRLNFKNFLSPKKEVRGGESRICRCFAAGA